ncbi:MAG TPA: cytochrome P450 [Acidimicrobiales bacterium]|jgi:cytochrome P450|nr:cytochrome P450 [Acidimicrobiales bacterium]
MDEVIEDTTAGSPFASMDPDMAAHPQVMFKALRDECPVMAIEGTGVVLTRKVEIDEALRHPEIFTSNMDAVDLKNARPMIPLQIDPPEHKKYRKLLDPIFAPRRMAAMDDSVSLIVNNLIDGFIDQGEVDFAQAFSVPFPSEVFLTLLGLPLGELDRFLAMKDGIIRPDHVTGKPYGSRAVNDFQQKVADSVYEYFNEVLDAREVTRQDDLLSLFLDAEVDGQRLTRNDILDICFLFLIAGLDTVTATLDCMFAFLAQHPEHRQQLVDDPSLIPSAIEELLRWETPVMGVVRASLEDTSLGGCPVKKGDQVMIMIGSANTDEAEFEDPDTVRFDREANRHIAFGGGIHRCLGSHLARLELRVALREWHRRIPEYSVEPDHTLVYTGGIRSIDHFPMRFTAAKA